MGSFVNWRAVSALAAVFGSAASAQSVLVVDASNGPGTDYTNLPTAIAAAHEGDVVLIRSGTYDQLVIASKELTVIADAGSLVTISDTLNVEGLTHTQSVAIRGLRVLASDLSYAASLENCSGPVWIEDCEFQGSNSTLVSGGIFAANCDGIAFIRSSSTPTLFGAPSGRAGLIALDSNIHSYDSVFVGTDGTETLSNPIHGAGGVSIIGGFFFGAGSVFQGGGGGDGAPTIIGCTNGGNGGEAMRVTGVAPTVFLLENLFSGGNAGAPSKAPCTPGAGGKALVYQSGLVTPLLGSYRAMSTNSPLREGEVFQETYTGMPGEFVAVGLSFGQKEGVFSLGILGSSHLAAPSAIQLRGIIPASGTLVKSFPIPELSVGAEAVVIYEQPIFGDLVTGKIVIGAPSLTVFLDESL